MLNKYPYLNDEKFLDKLDALNTRIQYVSIDLLSFDEKTIKKHLEGSITAGSLTVNGTSAARRTISLTMLAKENENTNITNLDNEISLNKKVDIKIGYENLIPEYKHYGNIIWFPCGRFLISSASITRNTNSWNISIQGKDKMSKLDGTVGGSLPASTTFHEVELEDGTIVNPTIFEIIKNAVHQYGMEDYDNIIINDLEMTGRNLMQYTGPSNTYFESEFRGFVFKERTEQDDGSAIVSLDTVETGDYFPYKTLYGTNVGYEETPLTYPGELVLNAGDTIVSLLTKINEVLGGNYEFFYDLEGRFIFQEKRNFLNTSSPLNEISINDYVETYTTTKWKYYFNDLSQVSSFAVNPKYDNIKNDFIVWGERTTAAGAARPIRYHLVIDEKPKDLELSRKWMWAVYTSEDNYRLNLLRYEFTNPETQYDIQNTEKQPGLFAIRDEIVYDEEGYEKTICYRDYCYPHPSKGIENNESWYLIAKESDEWREELYRKALINGLTTFQSTGYDVELLSEWRKLYDTLNTRWNETNHWNPDVIYNPSVLDYWLDFIDSTELSNYSINQIGKRTKIENKNNIKSLYVREPLEDLNLIRTSDREKINEYNQLNKKYFLLSEEDATYFSISSSGMTAFDQMRNLLQNHLIYNIAVSITCVPRYYFEPNQLIFINDGTNNAYNGTYFMTQFTLPLTYNGNMTITANQLAKRI